HQGPRDRSEAAREDQERRQAFVKQLGTAFSDAKIMAAQDQNGVGRHQLVVQLVIIPQNLRQAQDAGIECFRPLTRRHAHDAPCGIGPAASRHSARLACWTTRPSSRTTTSSANCATSARSWVTYTIGVPSSSRTRAR